MKLSKFNILEQIENDLIIYNSLTSGILSLDTEYAKAFKELAQNGECSKADLVKELEDGNMVLADNINEMDNLKINNLVSRFRSNVLSLTIAPTLECNFACTYCYEDGYRHNTMNRDVQNAIVEYVKRYINHIEVLDITWYGGEPLLAIGIIESLTTSFLDLVKDKINYGAGIVSNGYNLTKEVAQKLRDLKVEHIQVTVDGPPDIHDKRRFLHNGQGTFEKIINNIKECHEIIPITIRINVDRSNIYRVDELLDWFESSGFKGKVPFHLAPVDNINGTCSNNSCMSMAEFSDNEVKWYEKALSKGFYNVSIPKSSSSICGAVSLNSYVIDPKGDLYKCWDNIGHVNECVGNIFDGPNMNNKLAAWLLYDPFVDEQCNSCAVFPTCLGGCPNSLINQGDRKCKSIRFNAPNIIKLYDHMKKLKKTNDVTVNI